MTKLETDPALLDAMKKAASRFLSPKEALQQRVSFVMASLSENNDMTREQVQNVVEHKGSDAADK